MVAGLSIDELFAAHFTDGHDIGEHGVLIAVAAACGLDPFAVHDYLRGNEDLEAVHTDNLRAHRLGINGVPCFVVGGRHAIAGAQEPEVIERLLDVAALDSLED